MADQFNVHPDFQKLRAIALSFNPAFLSFMNGVLQLAVSFKSRPFNHLIERTQVTALDGHRIPVWIIKPENLKTPAGALLYLHGGAFIMKHAPQHVANAVRYALDANCCVIFVDFRMPPKYPFPTPFNDCYNALQWAVQNAEKLGIDKRRIAVGGDSAGGALAATVAQKARDEGIELCGQLLLYPVTDADCNTRSGTLYQDVAPLKRFSSRAMWDAYLKHSQHKNIPQYASPVHGNLTGLPPAYVESTEFDALRDETLAYAQALMKSGVDVTLNETKQTVHGYDLVAPNARLSQDAMANRVQFLRKLFF